MWRFETMVTQLGTPLAVSTAEEAVVCQPGVPGAPGDMGPKFWRVLARSVEGTGRALPGRALPVDCLSFDALADPRCRRCVAFLWFCAGKRWATKVA